MFTKHVRPLAWTAFGCLALAALAALSLAAAQPSTEPTEPNAVMAAPAQPASFDSATSTGRPPDENPPAANGIVPAADPLTFRYYTVSGATLRGRSSTTTYAYTGVGCSYVTAGSGASLILNTELDIPVGSVIKYLRVYYDDTNNASGVRGFVTRYTPGQATNDLVSVGSSDAFSGGHGFVVSAEITETVNFGDYAYTLIGWPDATGAANQICGLRVAYYPPTGSTYLPTISRPL